MAASGPGELAVIEEHLTAAQYVCILEDVMLPSVRAMLTPAPQTIYIAMDNARSINHKVREWLKEHPDIVRIEWPPRSPDLMPIENLWEQMTNNWDLNLPRNKENLIAHTQKTWENIRTSDICNNLVKSMPQRLQNVIESRGSYTKY